MAAVAAVLGYTGLVDGDKQNFTEALQPIPGQAERIRNKGLFVHTHRLVRRRAGGKRCAVTCQRIDLWVRVKIIV